MLTAARVLRAIRAALPGRAIATGRLRRGPQPGYETASGPPEVGPDGYAPAGWQRGGARALWWRGGPRPVADSAPAARSWWRGRLRQPGPAAVAALVLAAVVALPLAVTAALRGGPVPAGGSNPPASGPAARQAAARWVAAQVSRSADIGCTAQLCALLAAQGLPARRLLPIGPPGSAGRRAAVLVTPAGWGGAAGARGRPQVLAAFGRGPARVEVRLPAAALTGRADLLARQREGHQLARNLNLRLTARARAQLLAGQVDPRLVSLIAYLCSQRQTQVLAFGDSGPGASPGVPLRSAMLTGVAASLRSGPHALLSALPSGGAQVQAPRISQARAGGRPALRVEFAAPAPPAGPLT